MFYILLASWCSGCHYCITLFSKACTQVLLKSKTFSWRQKHLPRRALKKVFLKIALKIAQNSQGNTCVGVSFLIKSQAPASNFIKNLLKKRLRYICFPIDFNRNKAPH